MTVPRGSSHRWLAVSFAAGLVFAVGLGISGMTHPSKVLAFLDVAGAWDPSLAFVMGGALAVYVPVHRWAARRKAPLLEPAFALPHKDRIDGRLVAGAVIFGVGWGLSGFCPGPALVSVASGALGALVFVGAMLGGMALHALSAGKTEARAPRVDG